MRMEKYYISVNNGQSNSPLGSCDAEWINYTVLSLTGSQDGGYIAGARF
jgi:hypothetical protein